MTFRIAQKTLESLEWPRVVALLQARCRTPQGRLRLAARDGAGEDGTDEGAACALPFESSLAGTRERLGETSEARALLDADELPPLGGAMELDAALTRAEKGGVMSPLELRDTGATLAVIDALRGFLAGRREIAPRLAERAETLGDWRALRRDIERSIDPSGEVSDDASPALADARRDASRIAAVLQRRLERFVQSGDVRSHLSDDYYTVRGDRYVLPVRADARGHVKGIVHDASRSGTTLFIEPEAVVELNNRLKQAELTAAREIERVLRELTGRVAAGREALGADLDVLCEIDLAFARGGLSRDMRAVEPAVAEDGVFDLPLLRHPLIDPDECVENDVRLGGDFHVLVVSGPNGGGKTVAMKAAALAALFARAGLHVPAGEGARVDLVDGILVDIGDGQDIRESLSTFSAHMVNLAAIVKAATRHTLVVLDEVGVGTDPGEGAALAQAVLETLADRGVRVIATTHYNLLKEMAAVDARFCNASVDFDPDTLAPTYRLHLGTPGGSSAAAVAARMGMPGEVLERAGALLEREDRRLDRMLSELGASRSALEREQREAARLRSEGEAARDEYRSKLEALQERRDKIYRSMRDDLDEAFRDAHTQVAAVIRDLQRGIAKGSARDAAHARERLQGLEARAREAEARAGVGAAAGPEETADAVDWRRARPGDAVRIPAGGTGSIESLPDAKGRVRVRAGSATLVVPAERLRRAKPGEAAGNGPAPRARVSADVSTDLPDGGGTLHCDVRGMRVEEALDRVAEALDRALAEGRDGALFVHGIGTGALRRAVRDHLRRSAHVGEVRAPERDQGGDGATLALLTGART